MRVAVCFSGGSDRYQQFPTSFLHQLEYYKNFPYCDLFFSHWSSPLDDWLVNFLKESIPNLLKNEVSVNVEFTEKYHWSTKYTQEDCYSQANSPGAMLSMFGGIKNADLFRQAYEKEHNIKYDFVLRSRPDIHYVGNIDWQRELNLLRNHKLVMFTKNWHWFDQWDQHGMLCDQWFMAEPHVMTQVTSLVDRVDEYIDAGCRFHPESLLWWHIKNSLTPPSTHNMKYNNYGFIDAEIRLKGHHTGW
jgi:hypothetical protein